MMLRTEMTPAAPAPAADPVHREPQVPASGRARRAKPYNAGNRSDRPGWLLPVLAGTAVALGATALAVNARAKEAQRRHPPVGRFIKVDGVRLHYLERGRGDPVVILHGNGAMVEEMVASGLVERLARDHRVIVIDRPGFGRSDRPRTTVWTPMAQAALIGEALRRLGIRRPVVLGHSWGTLVALSLALQSPDLARALVLVSGYYFPTARADVPLFSGPAIPILGDVMRYTVSPLVTGALLPKLYRKIFAPNPVPPRFQAEFPHEMTLRPWQLRAASADTALMIPAAAMLSRHYRDLHLPVSVIAGTDDQVADFGRQSARLHRVVPDAELIPVPGCGHMVHHFRTDLVADAVERVAERTL